MYYFEKVAKEVKKTDNADETNKYITTTTGGSLVGFGGDIGLKAEPLLFKRLSDEDKKEYIKNVVDKYEPGTTIHVNKNNLGINRAEHRYGSNPRINISEDRDFTFLHELGHADNALKRHNKLHNKNKQKGRLKMQPFYWTNSNIKYNRQTRPTKYGKQNRQYNF